MRHFRSSELWMIPLCFALSCLFLASCGGDALEVRGIFDDIRDHPAFRELLEG